MALGAFIGLFGSIATNVFGIFNRIEDRKLQKLKNEFEEVRFGHELSLITLQSQARVAETEQEAFLTNIEGTWGGMEQTIRDQTEAIKKASPWVANLMALFRPFLTLSFLGIVGWLVFKGEYPQAAAASIDLALMSTTWWFGDRSIKRLTQMASHARGIRGAGGEF